jgi:hypothetical protein
MYAQILSVIEKSQSVRRCRFNDRPDGLPHGQGAGLQWKGLHRTMKDPSRCGIRTTAPSGRKTEPQAAQH